MEHVNRCSSRYGGLVLNPVLFSFFLFIKAGNPIATVLCGFSQYGEIELQNVSVGNCNENLETLEKQVCPRIHLMGKKF
jgi:hypothetical protein